MISVEMCNISSKEMKCSSSYMSYFRRKPCEGNWVENLTCLLKRLPTDWYFSYSVKYLSSTVNLECEHDGTLIHSISYIYFFSEFVLSGSMPRLETWNTYCMHFSYNFQQNIFYCQEKTNKEFLTYLTYASLFSTCFVVSF